MNLKNLFLQGKYADQISLTTALTLIILILLTLTYFLPPASFLILPLLYYSLKYLWFYDGVSLSPLTRFKWNHFKIPEKAGTLGAVLTFPFILGLSFGFKVPSWFVTPFVLLTGLFVSFFVILKFHRLPEEKKEEKLKGGDFFIAGWTAGALVGASVFLLELARVTILSFQNFSLLKFLISPSFFLLGFMALFGLILILATTLLTGYTFKKLGIVGPLFTSLLVLFYLWFFLPVSSKKPILALAYLALALIIPFLLALSVGLLKGKRLKKGMSLEG